MTWELYEVWSEDDSGHQELVDTTKSLKEARLLARQALEEGAVFAEILRETPDGDMEQIETLQAE
jgi:hypothetical protein